MLRGTANRPPAEVLKNHKTYLDDEGLPAPPGGDADHGHVRGLVDKVLETVEDTSPSSRSSTVDSPLVDWFPRDAGVRIDVIVALEGSM